MKNLYSNQHWFQFWEKGLKNINNIAYYERNNIDEDVLLVTNVLYMTRLQKERFSQEKNVNNFVLNKETMFDLTDDLEA